MFLLLCNKSFIDEARLDKMVGYKSGPFSLFFFFYTDLDFVVVHINRIRDLVQCSHSALMLN